MVPFTKPNTLYYLLVWEFSKATSSPSHLHCRLVQISLPFTHKISIFEWFSSHTSVAHHHWLGCSQFCIYLNDELNEIEMAEMENGGYSEGGRYRVYKDISQISLQVLAVWTWYGVLPLCPREERVLYVLAGKYFFFLWISNLLWGFDFWSCT